MTVLVTGASGLVGQGVVHQLESRARAYRATSRSATMPSRNWITVDAQDEGTDWSRALHGIDSIVHLAARVHVMRDSEIDPLDAFRRVNVRGTLNLARQAVAAGARRFVFISSIKVNGESGRFRETDSPAPVDPYGQSKLEAEQGLREIAESTGLEVVIIRPPLVYGPGVRANFHALINAVRRGIPLPLGAVHNSRSLVARDNLVDFILTCIDSGEAAGETFLVSDGEDVSTPELIRRIASAMHRKARLVNVPVPLLRAAAAVTGRRNIAQRLLGSLEVDITKARERLHWTPPISLDEGLRQVVGQGAAG